jgi:hemerythrin superfamily protein
MNNLSTQLLPSATNMVRLDHTHVLSTFHQYKASAPARVRIGLANTICLALEVHAQLEEDIFYPAVREVAPELLADSPAEHQEMREAIARLRQLDPDDPAHEEQLMALMRMVMHHVADEETLVLPAAERLLPGRLGEIGLRMTRRRFELVAPRSGEIALNMGRAASGNKLLLAGCTAAALGLLWWGRAGRRAFRG